MIANRLPVGAAETRMFSKRPPPPGLGISRIVRSRVPECHALIRMDPFSVIVHTAAAGAPGSDSPWTSGGGCAVGPGLGATGANEGAGLDGVERGKSGIPKMQPERTIGHARMAKTWAIDRTAGWPAARLAPS